MQDDVAGPDGSGLSEGLGAALPQASPVENTTSEWMTGESPSWSAYLQRVELELNDGRTVQGELFVSEELFDGEEEVAVWSVRDDAGHEHILNNKPWRFCTPNVGAKLPYAEQPAPERGNVCRVGST